MDINNYLEIELFEKYCHILFDGYKYYYKDSNYTTFSFENKHLISTFIYNLIITNEILPKINVITESGCILTDIIKNKDDVVYYIEMLSDMSSIVNSYLQNRNENNIQSYICTSKNKKIFSAFIGR